MGNAPEATFQGRGTLRAIEPFELRISIRFLSGFSPCKGEQRTTPTTLTKAINLDGQDIMFRVSLTDHPAIVGYELFANDRIDAARQTAAEEAITEYLSLRDDLSEFYRIAAEDHPSFARIKQQLNGLHHVRFLTVAEIACWAVLSQRSFPSVALATKQRLMNHFGHHLVFDGETYQAFPTLAELATLTDSDWFELIRHERKSRVLHNLIREIANVGEDFLRTAPYTQADQTLRNVRGVGEFTAGAILLRGLGRMDDCPIDLNSFTKVTKQVYGASCSNDDIKRRYGRHIGYWAFYLHSGMGSLKEPSDLGT